MTFKEMLRFVYGMAMGTSVPYIKPTHRFLWPTAWHKIDDDLEIFLGGSSVCILCASALINTNSGAAAKNLFADLQKRNRLPKQIVLTSVYPDFSEGYSLYPQPETILLPNVDPNFLRKYYPAAAGPLEMLDEETKLSLDGETLQIVPIENSASTRDLVVFIEKRKVLCLGTLFYNRIHPVLHSLDGMNIQNWIRNLEQLMTRFQPEMIIPAEGDIGSPKDVSEFISYLTSLSDPKVEFAECRKRFDWIEIPGQTSLEENFDLLRAKDKTHTTF